MKLALKAAPWLEESCRKQWAGGWPGLPSRLFAEHVLCAAAQRELPTASTSFPAWETDRSLTMPCYELEKRNQPGERVAETAESGPLRHQGFWRKATDVMVCTMPVPRSRLDKGNGMWKHSGVEFRQGIIRA